MQNCKTWNCFLLKVVAYFVGCIRPNGEVKWQKHKQQNPAETMDIENQLCFEVWKVACYLDEIEGNEMSFPIKPWCFPKNLS